jgi:topoisomerase-4 subunit B
VRFKPDEQIFGKGAKFKPARLFKMARSKAYLFGGVEIRWSVDPVHLADKDDTPQKAVLHFPGGLKDYLDEAIQGRPRVADEIFAGNVKKEGGHGSVEWAVAWLAGRKASSTPTATPCPRPKAAPTSRACGWRWRAR